jgi:hypothetical protein
MILVLLLKSEKVLDITDAASGASWSNKYDIALLSGSTIKTG